MRHSDNRGLVPNARSRDRLEEREVEDACGRSTPVLPDRLRCRRWLARPPSSALRHHAHAGKWNHRRRDQHQHLASKIFVCCLAKDCRNTIQGRRIFCMQQTPDSVAEAETSARLGSRNGGRCGHISDKQERKLCRVRTETNGLRYCGVRSSWRVTNVYLAGYERLPGGLRTFTFGRKATLQVSTDSVSAMQLVKIFSYHSFSPPLLFNNHSFSPPTLSPPPPSPQEEDRRRRRRTTSTTLSPSPRRRRRRRNRTSMTTRNPRNTSTFNYLLLLWPWDKVKADGSGMFG